MEYQHQSIGTLFSCPFNHLSTFTERMVFFGVYTVLSFTTIVYESTEKLHNHQLHDYREVMARGQVISSLPSLISLLVTTFSYSSGKSYWAFLLAAY